jgi:triacylglycerol lipase
MGGIVLREYLAHHKIENLGRVVMLAPPNQGSEIVDQMKTGWLYRFLTGPAGQELGTDPDSVPKRLGPANFAFGVIAGDRSANPFFSARLPGWDDGKVSVSSTYLEGMTDFYVVHYSHTWLPARKQVIEATVRFLANNSFAETP